MSQGFRLFAVAAVAVGMALVSPAATRAQGGPSPRPPSGESAEAWPRHLSHTQLEAFAKASLRIEDIGREWRPRIAKTIDVGEAKKMQGEAVRQMVDAVASQNLTLEEYNRISLAYNEEPELRDRIDRIRKGLR